jgi:hypothetical protein
LTSRLEGRDHRCVRQWVLAASTLTFACGGSGSGPMGPVAGSSDGTPSISAGTVVSLRSGETDQPVAGATIALSGQSETGIFSTAYTTDAAGQFRLDRTVLLSSTPLLEATAPGFLVRSTVLRLGETTTSMWPASSPTGLDEVFSSTVVYSSATCPAVNTGQIPLRKVPSSTGIVRVSFDSTLQDAAAETAHQQAIARLNTALEGSLQYQFTTTVGQGVSFTAGIDPNASTCTAGTEPLRAATSLSFVDGNISGGRLIYCSVAAARSATLVLHELGHSFGLRHSASTSDVMYCSTGRPVVFSARERVAIKLMGQRRSGTRWPDNDRETAGPLKLDRRGTEVIACGATP